MAWGGFRNPGGYNIKAYLMGDWKEIVAVKNNTIYRLGNCSDGILRLAHTYYRHYDTQFPSEIDAVFPINSGINFSCTLEEINAQNVSFLLGQTLNVGTQNYLYAGVQNTNYHFTLRGMRTRPDDGVAIEFRIHKCLQASLFSLASGDSVIGSPMNVEGLDDAAGDYGGSDSMPLGWIYVPTGLPPVEPAGLLDGAWGDGLPDWEYGDDWGDGVPDFTFD